MLIESQGGCLSGSLKVEAWQCQTANGASEHRKESGPYNHMVKKGGTAEECLSSLAEIYMQGLKGFLFAENRDC